jgi:hypothetical protein
MAYNMKGFPKIKGSPMQQEEDAAAIRARFNELSDQAEALGITVQNNDGTNKSFNQLRKEIKKAQNTM